MKYSETAFSNSNVKKKNFWSIKNTSEVIEKLRLRNFQGSLESIFFRLFYFINLIATWSYQIKSVVSGKLVFQQRVKILPLYFT